MTQPARTRIAIFGQLHPYRANHDPAPDILSFPVFAMSPAQLLQDTAKRLDGIDQILALVHTLGAFWPVRDVVKAALGLNFASDQRFKVQQGRAGQWMDIATFAAGSYRVFAHTDAPEALRVVAPDYLAAQIGGTQA